jgi:N-acetyl sugar amidotransferase
MDTSDPYIIFNNKGICNHCEDFDQKFSIIPANQLNWQKQLSDIVTQIKKCGKNNEYDCVIGLSGGVDSSFVAYQVKQLNLRPLAVHLDNGWDSELAIKNIENIVNILGIDLYTHVIDWEEFKDLQMAFLKASVIDIEILTDHAIVAILYQVASKYNIKFFIGGGNVATEGIMPSSWVFSKNDSLNIKDIHKKFGKQQIKTFPLIPPHKLLYYRLFGRVKQVNILNYMPYSRQQAIEVLQTELKWRNYGGKHHESAFTKFYQNYILPQKFKVDKRRAHYSTLICSDQISRELALELLEQPLYNAKDLQQDIEYFMKKFNLTQNQFKEIMLLPVKAHTDYFSLQQFKNLKKILSNLSKRKTR